MNIVMIKVINIKINKYINLVEGSTFVIIKSTAE